METKICKVCQKEKAIDSFEKIKDKRRGDTYFFIRDTCPQCIYQKRKGKKIITPKKEIKEYNPRYYFDIKKVIKVDKYPVTRYCQNELCGMLLTGSNKSLFCNDWCKEQNSVSRTKLRVCKYCGLSTEPILRPNGTPQVWKNLCENCIKLKYSDRKVITKKEEIYQRVLNTLVYNPQIRNV